MLMELDCVCKVIEGGACAESGCGERMKLMND